jgi:PAS domain S-box-containing protein
MDHVLAPWWRTVWIVGAGWVLAASVVGGLAGSLTREWRRHRAAEDRYRVLFKASPYPTIALDGETRRFLAISDAAVEQYGWSRDELLTMSSDDLYPKQDLARVEAMRQEHVDLIKPLGGFRHLKKDGTIIDVEMSMRPIDLEGRPGYLATAVDVTGKLRSEQERLAVDDQLRQAQKMEAVGQLTGGIAHDFNNILFVILASADALQEEKNLDAATLAARLEEITQAVLRASNLTRQLLAFSRQQPLHPLRTDMNRLVSDTGKLLRRALGGEIEIDSVFAEDLYVVDIDRSQLETALVNLCINARDAMPGGGHLLIETCNTTLDEHYALAHPGAVAGAYAMLAVTDTGGGMPPEVLAKVFDPFFTTKEVGKGTGLGLSMVYGFIKQSNGHIRIYSEVGVGTSIKLYLPRADGPAEEEAVRVNKSLPRGSEHILVVEDEPQVRGNVVQQLQSLGYTVTQAPDGEAGLAAFAAADRPIDLLLTDVVMPGPMSGKALADEIARRSPRTRTVFMSGFTEVSSVRHGRLDEASLLLSKPFRKRDLAQILRHALDSVPPPRVPPAALAIP